MTALRRISLLAAFSTFLFIGTTSLLHAADAPQPASEQGVEAAASPKEPGCPFAASGPCCAECQGKLAGADAAEKAAEPPVGCPCQRARQLQLEKQQQQQAQ